VSKRWAISRRFAIARFNQVKGVSDAGRDEAWKRIQRAAKRHGIEMNESSWRYLPGHGKK
jgi:hypothetical protein